MSRSGAFKTENAYQKALDASLEAVVGESGGGGAMTSKKSVTDQVADAKATIKRLQKACRHEHAKPTGNWSGGRDSWPMYRCPECTYEDDICSFKYIRKPWEK